MADNVNSTPAPAPDINPVPSTVPDLSGLTAPGNQPSPYGTSDYQDAMARGNAAVKAASDAANAPVITPNTPHARLASMVSGLMTGLSALGTSIATRGQKGGVEEVQQVQAQQQEQKLQAQQAATAQRNQQIQQQIAVADTNFKMGQNILLMAQGPLEWEKSNLEVQQGQQNLATGKIAQVGQAQDIRAKALQDLIMTGDVDAYNSTLQQVGGVTGTPTAAAPTGQGAAAPAIPPAARANWQNSVDAAVSAYPNDATIKQASDAMTNPNADPKSMASAANIAKNRMAALDAGAASRQKQADASLAATNAQYAGPKSQADIAKARGQAAAAETSRNKNVFELGQEQREAQDLATPDVVGFSSPLTPKEYDKRYDAFTKSKDYQTLSTLKGSYQQFNDTLNHIAQTGDMSGAESVVGLFNAIGISATPLAGKGFRINSNTVEEHAEARGIDQAAYQKLLALKNGDVITPKQLQDYSNIAAGVYHNAYVNAADEAHRQGLPVDFLPQGGGQKVDPITARIYTDVILHSNPALAKDPKAAQTAAKQAAALNGWAVQ